MTKVFELNAYKAPDFLVRHTNLELDISQEPVQSRSTLVIEPNPEVISRSADLVLHGENMTLQSVSLNDKVLSPDDYILTDKTLTIKKVPQEKPFTLETTALLGNNPDLFGLYKTEGICLVKAETEGLRRVLYCLDRPDVLSTYRTTITANKKEYPVMLSNGLSTQACELPNGLHSVTWFDELPKPSYLFALVAGKLARTATTYITRTGRELPIEFYVSADAVEKCTIAKETLKSAMRWEEQFFNLSCDLPQHMIACVDKYASGASEPTGLNIFNAANLLTTEPTRTDADTLRIIEVVAHEFFHYWTGDRVTIRDWFNLPFKEGLTTFRAAAFREHLFGTDLIRLLDSKNLDERAPRQSTYTSVRSLYTAAAYEKSADIFRMIMLTVGEKMFYEGLSQFLQKNDGAAVTLENLIDSLTEFTGKELPPFLNWFTESGIPEISVTDEYNPDTQCYTLKFKSKDSKNRPIPVVLGLLDSKGKEILNDSTVMLDKPEMEFQFQNIKSKPVPSLFRSFSAPIYSNYQYTQKELLVLMQHDTNTYNRAEAAKKLITEMVHGYCAGKPIEFSPEFTAVYRSLLTNKNLNNWLTAEILTLPSEEFLIAAIPKPDFEKIAEARQLIHHHLAQELRLDLLNELHHDSVEEGPIHAVFDIHAAGTRRLNAVCNDYLQTVEPAVTEARLVTQFNTAMGNNMTETISALSLLAQSNSTQLSALLERFYTRWKDDPQAINYWFNIQAAAHSPNVVELVEHLLRHPGFDLSNPNKVYALVGFFINNPYGFHASSGLGYKLVADLILQLEQINPTLAANLTDRFTNWNEYDLNRQKLILKNLAYISKNASTTDVSSMAKKGLDKAMVEHTKMTNSSLS